MPDISPVELLGWIKDERARRAAAVAAGQNNAAQPENDAQEVSRRRRILPMSMTKANYYLREMKGFCRWLAGAGRRMPENPLAHLDKIKSDETEVLQRRALPPADFADFIAAARVGEHFRLAGEDRAALYVVAAYTGFRASELASLTRESFDLDADPPTATVEATYCKRRRRDVQELRRDVAKLLRPWLETKPEGSRLWPGSWPGRAAEMVRRDLAAATAARKAKDADADPIPFADVVGRVFDFHALRHQFISNLAAAGVHPKHAQALARHSTITLTMDHYTHLQAHDFTAALEKLPAPPPIDSAAKSETGEAGVLKRTGTDSRLSSGCQTVAK